MDKETVQQRIIQISTEMHQLTETYRTLQAHLNEANYWLSQINETESKSKESANGDSNIEQTEPVTSEIVCGTEAEEVPTE